MVKFFVPIAAILAALLTAPAVAQDQNSSGVAKADKAAKAAIGVIYGAAGTRACGTPCGKVASKGGVAVYEKAQDLSKRGAEKIQKAGRAARERFGRKGGE